MRMKCQACGQKGHWAGDPECRAGKATAVAANFGVLDEVLDESNSEGFKANSSEDDEVAFMALRESDDWDMLDLNEALLYSDRWHNPSQNYGVPDLLTAADQYTFVPSAPTLD